MSQTIRTRYNTPLSSEEQNLKFARLLRTGVVEGMECVIGSAVDRVTITTGRLMTADGLEVEEDATLTDYFRPGVPNMEIPANATAFDRIDIIACHCYYQNDPNLTAYYEIIEGTPAASPVPPVYNSWQMPIAVGVVKAGEAKYDSLAPWPRTWRFNNIVDVGVEKISKGGSIAIKCEVINRDFTAMDWTAGIRVRMIAPGTKSDGAAIAESDWSDPIEISESGEAGYLALLAEVVAARGTKSSLDGRLDVSLENGGDLHPWAIFKSWQEGFHQPGVKKNFQVRLTGDSTTATTIDVEAGIVMTEKYLRVENESTQVLAIPTNAASSYSRYDIVVLTSVWNAPDVPAAPTYSVVEGTPAAAPAYPAIPADSTLLATCYIPAGATTYTRIYNAARSFYFNCQMTDAQRITITNGKRFAFVVSITPWESVGSVGDSRMDLKWHDGDVADGADITASMTTSLGIVKDGIEEIFYARGIMASLPVRLAVSLGSDGTLNPNTVGSSQIQDGSVDTAELANDAVWHSKIADEAVWANNLSPLAVTEAKLFPGAVTSVKIADSNVITTKIADGNVTTAKILNSNVTTAKIADGAVEHDKVNFIELSGNWGATLAVAIGGNRIIQTISVTVPNGQSLVIRKARFYFATPDLQLTAEIVGGSKYTSLSAQSDVSPAQTLCNGTGATETLQIGVHNSDGAVERDLLSGDGWHIILDFN